MLYVTKEIASAIAARDRSPTQAGSESGSSPDDVNTSMLVPERISGSDLSAPASQVSKYFSPCVLGLVQSRM